MIIDFEKNKAKNTGNDDTSKNPENLVLSFDEFQSISDDRIALACFTTQAKRLIENGIEPSIVYFQMYHAATFMASSNPDNYLHLTKRIHDDITHAATDLCEDRLK